MVEATKSEATVEKWNPLGFVDGILEDWLALPSPRDVVPSPGDVARSIIGPSNTLDAVGEDAAARIRQALPRR